MLLKFMALDAILSMTKITSRWRNGSDYLRCQPASLHHVKSSRNLSKVDQARYPADAPVVTTLYGPSSNVIGSPFDISQCYTSPGHLRIHYVSPLEAILVRSLSPSPSAPLSGPDRLRMRCVLPHGPACVLGMCSGPPWSVACHDMHASAHLRLRPVQDQRVCPTMR
jgi:hypothetical protein